MYGPYRMYLIESVSNQWTVNYFQGQLEGLEVYTKFIYKENMDFFVIL